MLSNGLQPQFLATSLSAPDVKRQIELLLIKYYIINTGTLM